MSKGTTDRREAARACWDSLEDWLRQEVQGYIQDLFEEGATELPGRAKSQRRQAVDENQAAIDSGDCLTDRNFDQPSRGDECHDEDEGHLFPKRRPGPTTATRPTPFRAAVRTARYRWRSGPPTVHWVSPPDGHP